MPVIPHFSAPKIKAKVTTHKAVAKKAGDNEDLRKPAQLKADKWEAREQNPAEYHNLIAKRAETGKYEEGHATKGGQDLPEGKQEAYKTRLTEHQAELDAHPAEPPKVTEPEAKEKEKEPGFMTKLANSPTLGAVGALSGVGMVGMMGYQMIKSPSSGGDAAPTDSAPAETRLDDGSSDPTQQYADPSMQYPPPSSGAYLGYPGSYGGGGQQYY